MTWLLLMLACGPAAEAPHDRDGDGSPTGVDCDDFDATRVPGAVERCDGVDEDCDGAIDEDAGDAWMLDADGDGWGDDATAIRSCVALEARVARGGDCDDADPAVSPGAAERCDGVDADCDGAVDDDPLDGASWYPDLDGDGFGDGAAVRACDALTGHVADGGDCDDDDAGIHPGAEESCDGIDTDCDGLLDVGAIDGTWLWPDADGDGYGDRWSDPVRDCDGAGRAANGLDRDDADAGISPAAGGSALVGTVDAGHAAWGVGGAAAGAGLGTAVHLDGGALFVGAPGAGRAYVFDGVAGYEGLGDAAATLAGGGTSGFGSAFATGDLDGDGVSDLVVGAPDDGTVGTNAGAAFLFAGPLVGARDADDALAIYAPSSRDSVGSALAVGDIDGDGIPDLAIGAPDHGNTGRLYLLRGPVTATPDLDAETSFGGLATLDRAGAAVAAGDLDGDGLAEVLAAAPGAGAVYVVPGGAPEGFTFADAATIGGRGGSYLTGRDVAVVPDVDGDGRIDVLVGGPAYTAGLGNVAGEAWLLSGPVDGARDVTRHAWATFVGAPGDAAGWSVGAGDLDGDGVTELLVGATSDDVGAADAGAVYVLRGAAGTHDLADADGIVVGHAASLRLGEDLAVGDLDGDGRAETAVGASGESVGGDGTGAAFVFWGAVR